MFSQTSWYLRNSFRTYLCKKTKIFWTKWAQSYKNYICPYFIIALTPSVESIKKPVLPKAKSAQMPKNNALCTEIREPEVARQLIILISWANTALGCCTKIKNYLHCKCLRKKKTKHYRTWNSITRVHNKWAHEYQRTVSWDNSILNTLTTYEKMSCNPVNLKSNNTWYFLYV